MRICAGLSGPFRTRGADAFVPSNAARRIGGLAGAFCLLAAVNPVTSSQSAPASTVEVQQILDRMMAADRATISKLRDYTSIRLYRLANQRFGKRADMTVRFHFQYPGLKKFEVLNEHGSGAIRSRVFRRMLASEVEASRDDLRDATQITPNNYSFRLVGSEDLDGRRSYVLEASPRTKNTYLFRGRIWVDAEDYAIAKIEGSPAQNPSFWIRRTAFVHRYAKFGPFWLAVSNRSETDVLVFGRTDVRIDYSDYRINQEPASGPSTGAAP